MIDSLGDRMKGYENVSRHELMRRTPVIVRVDGRAFHTLTRGCEKPFDSGIIGAMSAAALAVMDDMQNCKLAYAQSDEASFLMHDCDRLETEAWFGNSLQKIVSLSAAGMSVAFARIFHASHAMFDARAFNVPREEVANYFLWRARDWRRNSLQMIAQSKFSPKQLHGKNTDAMIQMLAGVGVDVDRDFSERERFGTFLLPGGSMRCDVQPNYASVAALVDAALAPPAAPEARDAEE